MKQGTEVTKDQVQTPSSQSIAPVQPLVVQPETQTPVSEPVVAPVSAPMPNLKPSIPYPSRRDNERRRDQANEQIEKFYEIFKDMSFEISFTDALILMPKFASTLKALIGNKEKLSEMAKTPINEHCSAVILHKFPRKLGDPGKFLIPCEFPGMEECLARCFLKTVRALIDVHKGELTLLIENEAITYNLDQTVIYSANYNQMTTNKIDVICEEYSQEVLGFSDVTVSGNTTPYDNLIISTTSPTLTLFGDSDFLLFEEADTFLDLEDDLNSPKINQCKDINLCLNWEKSHFMVKEDIVLGHKISKNGIEVDKAKVYVIAKLPHPTTVKEGIILGHKISKNRIEVDKAKVDVISKLPHPTTVKGFQTLKRKLTEAPILVAPDWDMPFEFMCDASDFAIGAVLGQRKIKHFQPIHYASKTMTDAQAHYTTTEKELLAVVYAFEKFWPYLVLSKSIVYTDHSTLKYLFN
nr:reverse transcriptase domain-containing protein [Tanacetum cinerariifolium]